ncbi:MAG: hypothetical protein EA377_04580 [Phycisphaerales bacterium]|nr:MAG: hypothetical protein EA377_04580 [Phycisphaerales bacterium]
MKNSNITGLSSLDSRPIRRTAAWVAGLACVLTVLMAAGTSSTHAETPTADQTVATTERCRVICGEILHHQRIKERAVTLPAAERRELLRHAGIEPERMDGELGTIYIRRTLDDAEIDAWRERGVHIHRSQYVPPVPGRHPHGFYLASIDYAALDDLREDETIVRVTSAETLVEPQHDLALPLLDIPQMHLGVSGIGITRGAGIRIAVADSGLDLTHPDLPEPVETFDVTSGHSIDEWSTDVSNTVIMHGTHVTGTVVGSGAQSNGHFIGGAPDADLYFYKIGNDTNGNASAAAIIKAINRAAEVGVDIFTMSYGSFGVVIDGSSNMSQAYDAAFEAGVLGFCSAGNAGGSGRHYSVELAPGEESQKIMMTLLNPDDEEAWNPTIFFRVVWRDEPDDVEPNIELKLVSGSLDPSDPFLPVGSNGSFGGNQLNEGSFSISPRDTKSRVYSLDASVAAGGTKTYKLRLKNTAESGVTPKVHLYQTSTGWAYFDGADPNYTLGRPADADTVMAVGAWAHRVEWINFLGDLFDINWPVDSPAWFTSRGPRVDGVLKPEIVAPGAMMISLRDSEFANNESRIISNNSSSDGSGPAEYYVAAGTSMASPLAAAAAALVLEFEPTLTAEQLRDRLMETASDAASPNPHVGHGLINVVDATGVTLADLNQDGAVDILDLLILLENWGSCAPEATCPGDVTGIGEVGILDLLELLENWS